MLKTDQWRVDIVKNGGDWTWNIRDNHELTISPGRQIATVNKYLRDVQEVSNLIAAAPALLAALERLIASATNVVDNWESGDLAGAVNDLDDEADCARAAIAQAEKGTTDADVPR